MLVLFVWSLDSSSKKKGKSALDGIDKALNGQLSKPIKKEEFKGKRDQVLALPTLGKLKADRIIVYGLGTRTSSRTAICARSGPRSGARRTPRRPSASRSRSRRGSSSARGSWWRGSSSARTASRST